MTRTQTPKRPLIVAWFLYDWGLSAWHVIMLSFVFSVYITSGVATTEDQGASALSGANALAGIIIAVLAPMMGSFSDAVGRRRILLTSTTLVVVLCCIGSFWMAPGHDLLYTAAALIAIGSVFAELGGIFYNSILVNLGSKESLGRLSGIGWAFGYVGGVVGLVCVLFLFIKPDVGLFGVTEDFGLKYRAVALWSAVWILGFSIPLMLLAPDGAPSKRKEKWRPIRAYVEIFQRLKTMWQQGERGLLVFLVASALYRDALAAIFTLAGVLALAVYGFTSPEVIYFGVAANVVAGLGVFLGGFADDRLGPRKVIIWSAFAISALGTLLLLGEEPLRFWILGLAICLFVGPIQSASRSLLIKLSRPGEENTNFGLYATTGRAATFVAPALFSMFVSITHNTRYGTIGIMVTLLFGALLFMRAKVGAAGEGQPKVKALN